MRELTSVTSGAVAQLREEFDASFSRPVVLEREVREGMLAIRAGQDALAIRTGEIAGIMRCPPVTPLPSEAVALCGVVGVRGRLVAAYSISGLLGMEVHAADGGWIVLPEADSTVALLFEELEGYEPVAVEGIYSSETAFENVSLKEVVRIKGSSRAVIRVPELLEAIHRSTRTRRNKE
jgi:purine-binding chemotaxis protein CheW